MDLNARNVLISQDGYFKVNNFGSSLILDKTEQFIDQTVGTELY